MAQINSKNSEIDTIKNQIASTVSAINALGKLLRMESNLTVNQLIELNQFIIEQEMSDSNYTDAATLLEDGKKKFEKMREPKIVATISLVNFYEILTEKHNWDRLDIGDVITAEHEDLGIHIKANVTDIDFNYADATISVTISNVNELLSDEERFMKDHLKNISMSNSVNMNQYKWDDAKATADDVTKILNNTWDAVKRDITAGVNEDVSISRRGIIIRDPADANKLLIMQHGQIALSNDNGNSWKMAITPNGIYADRLVGKILLGNKLIITDDNGTFNIEGNLLTIKDKLGSIRIQLGEYLPNRYGLKILGASGNVVLDETGILQTDTIQLVDNVDSEHPLKIKFYIAPKTMRYDEIMLNFSLERFRHIVKEHLMVVGVQQPHLQAEVMLLQLKVRELI
ncbi:phage tail spike protein [Paenibacillus pini]|uniref:Phage-related protein n=1 Tax=Paenibacillus pini JCM 16418 TaxID=1236976 RepID=W7Y9C6_9BACL|nr:phage tail spike protein [Paenibacillus pini]GAF07580.1 phage-related protein [Paenibacillus pini JCM 16418]